MRRIAFVALVSIAASGCYTVLRHPPVEPQASAEEFSDAPGAIDGEIDGEYVEIAEGERCAACHSDWELEQIDYAYAPLYVPIGPWVDWYCEPWWVDEVPETPVVGTAVQQGAGMTNDRPGGGGGGSGGAGFAPGVWIPGGTKSPTPAIVVLPPATSGPKPVAGTNPSDRSALDARDATPEIADPKPGSAAATPRESAPPASPPAEPSDPTPPAGTSTETPRGAPSNDPPARSSSESTSPRTNQPTPAPPPPAPAKPDQGRGMTNERPRPGR